MKPGAPTTAAERRYVPAAGRPGLTRFYDAAMAVTMREKQWRPWLVTRCSDLLGPGGTLVDIGAGTGTFALALAAQRSDAKVVAVDGDEEVLALAQAKAGAAIVEWRYGRVGSLDFVPSGADVVTISLLLHHLDREQKLIALREARAALRVGGSLVLVDWGRPERLVTKAGFALLRALDGRENTADHAAGRLPALIAEAGFDAIGLERQLSTMWGELQIYQAKRGRDD